MASNSLLWTTAAVIATSWIFIEAVKRRKNNDSGVHEIGESSEHLDEQVELQEPQRRNAEDIDRDGEEADEIRDIGAEWDNNDRARRALEEHQARQGNNERRINAWKQKGVVGTKKAKSLERRDRRRAYYEYVRQEAEREKQRIQLEEQMFGDLVAEEREERQKRIEEARQQLEESTRLRRQKEEEERRMRNERRDEIRKSLREKGWSALKDDEDIDIADELSDVLILENGEFAISLNSGIIDTIADELKTKGRLGYDEIQQLLTQSF